MLFSDTLNSSNFFCELPLDWGIKLHNSLKLLSQCSNDYSKLRRELIKIETCEKSTKNGLKCLIRGDENISCNDIFHILSVLSIHFQHIRSLQRLKYEVRSINIWLLELENLFKIGKYAQIDSFIQTTPVRVIILIIFSFHIFILN